MKKYKLIVDNKIKRYGFCNTILIEKVFDEESAILMQNTFPTLEKYIDHVHLTNNGKPARVITSLKEEILQKFAYLLKLKSKGVDLFFTDIEKIKEMMLNEAK